MNLKRIIFSVLSLITLSCTEEITPTPFTYTQVFTGETSKTWDLDKITVKEKGKPDQTFQYTGCEGDDRYIFYANDERLFEVTNGRTTCNPDQTGIEETDLLLSYSWEYNSSTTSLSVVLPHLFGYFVIPLTVTKITANTMVLELPFNEENTTAYVFEFRVVED